MYVEVKRSACLIVLLLTISITTNAQSAVLVMLKAEKNRLQYLEKINQKEKANLLRKESQKIMQATLNDFTDNFDRCPVYFFIDTNLQKVIDKKFDGVIVNNELNPVDFRSWENRSDHLIVYYGIPPTEITKEGNAWQEQMVHRTTYNTSDGIVILDHEFKRRRNVHYVYLNHKGKTAIKKRPLYNFASRNFSISYYEMGNELQKQLGQKGVTLPVN